MTPPQSSWPSNTEILDFYGIVDKSWYTDESRLRGIRAHAACHILADRKTISRAWTKMHSELLGYLDGYVKFLNEHRVTLLHSEREYVSDSHRFRSHPDEIIELDEFGRSDLEIKTGSDPAWVPLQTAGQVLTIGKPEMPRFRLLLPGNSTYRLDRHTDTADIDDFRALISAWWIAKKWRQRNGKS